MYAYEQNWQELERISVKKEWNNTPMLRKRIMELSWKKMAEWDIKDPRETSNAIRKFFLMEKWVRDNYGKSKFKLEDVYEEFQLENCEFLKNIFTDVIFPFLRKKLSK
jgi:hypothetical protein